MGVHQAIDGNRDTRSAENTHGRPVKIVSTHVVEDTSRYDPLSQLNRSCVNGTRRLRGNNPCELR